MQLAARWVVARVTPSPPGVQLWRHGKRSAVGSVLWDAQLACTSEEALTWAPGTDCVVARRKGLYELCLGFFGATGGALSVLVDGYAVAAVAEGERGGVVLQAHPAGAVAGASLVQYLTLPEGARVGAAYSCETGAQGFMSLRKL